MTPPPNAETLAGALSYSTLTIVPATPTTLAVGNSKTFSGSGGKAPYTFSLISGLGSVSPQSGLYTAGGSAGSATLQITDSLGATAQANVTINSALVLAPSSITMTANSSQTYTFQGQNGVPGSSGDTYSISAGPGSVGSSSGVYTVGTASGLANLQVQDSLGNSATSQIQNIKMRTNGSVNAAATDGVSWYLGGSFTALNPFEASKALVVDTTSGNPIISCDWKTGFNGQVAVLLVSGTSLYVGGRLPPIKDSRLNT